MIRTNKKHAVETIVKLLVGDAGKALQRLDTLSLSVAEKKEAVSILMAEMGKLLQEDSDATT